MLEYERWSEQDFAKAISYSLRKNPLTWDELEFYANEQSIPLERLDTIFKKYITELGYNKLKETLHLNHHIY